MSRLGSGCGHSCRYPHRLLAARTPKRGQELNGVDKVGRIGGERDPHLHLRGRAKPKGRDISKVQSDDR